MRASFVSNTLGELQACPYCHIAHKDPAIRQTWFYYKIGYNVYYLIMTSHPPTVPTHVGFILDGHRRWARANGKPVLEGHRQGYKVFKEVGLAALDRGVDYVTAYIWSKENWQRSTEEVDYLMKLLLWVADHELQNIHERGVRIRFLGNDERLSGKILEAIQKAEETTKDNTNGTLALCLNYAGRQEIVDATKKIMTAGIDPTSLTTEDFSHYIYAPDIPDVDLIVRSSGEQRISGFLLWRAAYAELAFFEKNWPDFTVEDLDQVLSDYASRQRRFGK